MRPILRIFAVALLTATTIGALIRWVVDPYRCNRRVKQATDRLVLILSLEPRSLRGAQLARINVDELVVCARSRPSDVAAEMVLAASDRFLGLPADAVAAYEESLLYERRPELYFNLGQTQLEMGDAKSGVRNLITACIYTPVFLDEIEEHHAEVKRAVDEYQTRLMEIARGRR